MTILLTILHVFVCFVLIAVILLQAGRGQGLTGPSFTSGNVQSLFGTRTADFLSKATSVTAICFLFTCIGLDIIEAQKSRSLLKFPNQTAPLDLDAIKKALEKVTEGEAGGVPAEVTEAVETATSEAADAAEKAAASESAPVPPSPESQAAQDNPLAAPAEPASTS